MKLIYAQEPLPGNHLKDGRSVFLAGPTPRIDTPIPSWRPEMVRLLSKSTGVEEILIPEPANGKWESDYDGQVGWEEKAIEYCDILVFWIPRDINNGMPGFTTNVEFGWWLDKKEHIVFGFPADADKCRYLEYKFKKQFPDRTVAPTMEEIVQQVAKLC